VPWTLINMVLLIAQSIAIAMYPSMVRSYTEDPESLPQVVWESIKYLLIVCLPIAVGGTVLADRVIVTLYGDTFANSVPVLQVTLWALPSLFLLELLGRVSSTLHLERAAARINVINAGITVILNLILVPTMGILGAALALVGGRAIRLVRRKPSGIGGDAVYWNPRASEIDGKALEGVDVVVNLAGENLASRWTESRMKTIRESLANYGAMKALCEQAAEKGMPGRVTNIRPGLIVGPLDRSDRFTYWAVRVQRGGEVLAPGDGSDPVQLVDVRDLATWILDCIEKKITGLFNAISPAGRFNMAEMLYGIKGAFTTDARFTKEIPGNTVQLTVTSPPFLNVVQYAADNWLRCWFNSIDAEEAAQKITMSATLESWAEVMGAVFLELHRITRRGGWIAFEVGEVRNGTINLDEHVVPLGLRAGFQCQGILINEQQFTKTANIWGIRNNRKGTNSNRIVIFYKE